MSVANNDAIVLLQLSNDLRKDLRLIQSINEEMDSALKTLGATMLDDGYQEISSFVAMAKAKLNAAVPETACVAKVLMEQARHILEMLRATQT